MPATARLMVPVMAMAMVLWPAVAIHPQPGERVTASPTPGRTGDATGIRMAPSLSLTAMPAYGVAPLTVGFFANAEDPENMGFVSYRWNFGDGRVSLMPPLMTYVTYDKPGTYVVTLMAVTADGRTASAFTGITVRGSGLGDSPPARP